MQRVNVDIIVKSFIPIHMILKTTAISETMVSKIMRSIRKHLTLEPIKGAQTLGVSKEKEAPVYPSCKRARKSY